MNIWVSLLSCSQASPNIGQRSKIDSSSLESRLSWLSYYIFFGEWVTSRARRYGKINKLTSGEWINNEARGCARPAYHYYRWSVPGAYSAYTPVSLLSCRARLRLTKYIARTKGTGQHHLSGPNLLGIFQRRKVCFGPFQKWSAHQSTPSL